MFSNEKMQSLASSKIHSSASSKSFLPLPLFAKRFSWKQLTASSKTPNMRLFSGSRESFCDNSQNIERTEAYPAQKGRRFLGLRRDLSDTWCIENWFCPIPRLPSSSLKQPVFSRAFF